MNRGFGRRFFAMLLAVVMTAGMISPTARADTAVQPVETTPETSMEASLEEMTVNPETVPNAAESAVAGEHSGEAEAEQASMEEEVLPDESAEAAAEPAGADDPGETAAEPQETAAKPQGSAGDPEGGQDSPNQEESSQVPEDRESASEAGPEESSEILGDTSVTPYIPEETSHTPEEAPSAPQETVEIPEEPSRDAAENPETPVPEESSAEPEDTSEVPEDTAEAPEETVPEPEETAEAPGDDSETPATQEPEAETPTEFPDVPEETSAEPEETAVTPEETGEAPRETTAEPQETEVPQETGETPQETSEVPEETAEVPVQPETVKTKYFTGNTGYNGLYVVVTDSCSALPQGTVMKVTEVPAEQIADMVSEALQAEVISIRAVDITFEYNGKEIEPDGEVSVRIKKYDKSMEAGEVAQILHIDDKENVEVVAETEKKEGTTSCTAEFSTGQFSIYAIVQTGNDARILVKYLRPDGTEIASMYVKHDDNMEQVLYDPGAGTLADGVYFRGWTTDPDYTPQTPALSVSDIRAQVTGMLPPEADGTVVTYYAMLFKYYRITYFDEFNISLGQEEVAFRADSSTNQQSYKLNMGYTVQDDTHHFEGWNVREGGSNIAGFTEGKIYQNNEVITITGNVDFGVNAPEGHWFLFDQNGKGGTYNAPQFILSGDHPVRPNDSLMVRNGYTFGGWFADKAVADQPNGGTQYNFNNPIQDRTTVYARWIPRNQSEYTVIIWKQNLDGDGYDFEEAISLTGSVGTTVNTVTETGSGNNRYARVNGVSKRYTGFHLKEYSQNVVIRTEGSAVVNVYYDRNEHTLQFQIEGYNYTPTTSNNGTQYGLVNGQYVQLTRHGRGTGNNPYYWTYGNNTTYNGTRYTRSSGWQTIKSITALYHQHIGDSFPIVGSNGVTYDHGERWAPQNSSTYTEVLVYIDVMPDEDITFRLNTSNNSTKYIYYYVEALPGETGTTVQYNGKTFVLYKSISANYGYFTEAEDYINLIGFTKYGYSPSNAWGSGGPDTVYCYYTRNNYTINFMDGRYVDGDGNPMDEEVGMGQIGAVNGIAYGTNISSYNDYTPDAAHTPSGYVFEGWYIDIACSQPYDFTTMPEGGISVYAKWRQKQYRVFLHPNYPEGAAGNINWGDPNQELNFRISEGGRISEPTGKDLAGFEFVGWYLDQACTQVFNGEVYVINENNVTDDYDKTTDMTNTYDVNGNLIDPQYNSDLIGFDHDGDPSTPGIDRFWITKKLDVYAKWRTTLEGAAGITVVYDANGGTGAPADTHTYVDGAAAPAGTASKAPAGSGKVFGYWEVQKWQDGAFTGTGVKVYPGGSFTVKADDAKVEEITPAQGSGDTKRYTVQLKAVYIDSEHPTPTHIYWFKNMGEDAFRKDENLEINAGVDIPAAPTRSGYRFLGWARVDISSSIDPDTAAAEAAAWEADSGNWTQDLTSSDLFLYHSDGTYHLESTSGTTVTQVAADEERPYHAMFAVWIPELTIRITGNTDEKEFNGSEQSVTGYTVKYFVAGEEVSQPQGVSVTLKPGKAAEARGTDINTDPGYPMGLTLADFDITTGDNYYYDPENPDNTCTDGWLKITPITITITITGSHDTKTYDAAPHSASGYTADCESSLFDPGKVVFTGNETAERTDVGTTYMGLAVSMFSYDDPNLTASFVIADDGYMTIVPRAVTITAKDDSRAYDGTALTQPEFTVSGLASGDDHTFAVLMTDASTITDAGTQPNVIATVDGVSLTAGAATAVGNYLVTAANGTLEITPAVLTVSVADKTVQYNGSEQYGNTETAFAGLADGHTAVIGYTPSQGKLVGTYNNGSYANDLTVLDAGGNDVTANYELTEKTAGRLIITDRTVKYEVTVKANSYEGTYDGQNHTASGFENETGGRIEVQAEGNTYYVTGLTSEASGKNVADSVSSIPVNGTARVEDADGNDVTGQFTVTSEPGHLTIGKAAVTLKSADLEKEFDGTALVNGAEPLAVETGFADGEGAVYTFTGSQTLMGESGNTFTYSLKANTNAENYNITATPGTLTVTDREQKYPITLVAVSSTDNIYDGAEKEAVGVETDTFAVSGVEYTVSNFTTADPRQTNAGTYPNTITPGTGGFVVRNAAGDDVTAQFTVTPQDGSLVIDKRQVSVSAADAPDVEYDGNEHTGVTDYVFGNVVDGHTAAITYTPAKGTLPDTYTGSYGTDFTVMNGSEDVTENYTLTEKTPGSLTITDRVNKYQITVKAKSSTGNVYDAQEHKAEGFETLFFDVDGNTYTVEGLTTGDPVGIDVCDTPNAITGTAVVRDAAGNDVTAQFTVGTEDGRLEILPKEISIAMEDRTLPYSGETQTGWSRTDENKETVIGLVNNETVIVSYTPSSGRIAGTYDNGVYDTATLSITDGSRDVTGNYTLTSVSAGKLTITADEENKLSVASADKNWDYDTQTHTWQVYTVTYGSETITGSEGQLTFTLPTGDVLIVIPEGNGADGVKNVSDSGDNSFSWTVENEGSYVKGSDSTGALTINPIALTIVMEDRTLPYNGEIQHGWSRTDEGKEIVTGLVNNETVTVSYTPSSGSTAGTYDNGAYDTATLSITDAGTDVTENYTLTSVTAGRLTITENSKVLVITSSTESWTYDGETHTDEVYTVTYDGAEVEADGSGKVFTLPTGDTLTITATAEGVKYVADTEDNNNTFTYELTNEDQYTGVSTAFGTLSITKAPLTITADSNEKEYDGTPLTDDGWQDTAPEGLKGTDVVESVTVTGSITNVGTEDNVPSAAVIKNGETDVTDNYNITYNNGLLEIKASTKALVITSSTESWTYDGETHTNEVYTVTYDGAEVEADWSGKVFTLPTGDTLTITATAEGVKDFSENYSSNNTFTYMLAKENQYTSVSTTFGTLSITKASLTITADSNEKEYDGTPLTDDGWQDTAPEGLKGTDVVESVTVTGSITNVGTEDNVPSAAMIKNGETDVTNNYNITYDNGVLKIKASTKELKVVSMDGSWTYDGNAHTKYEYTVTYGDESYEVTIPDGEDTGTVALSTGDVVTITPAKSASITHVAENTVSNAFGYIVENSDQYANQTKEQGKLTITPATLTIITGTASREYDGTPLTAEGSISGFVTPDGGEEETATFTVTGTITEVGGPVENSYSLVWDGTASESDYKLSEDLGTLTITPNTKALVITSSTESWTYDGETHTDEVYTVTYNGAEVEADGSGKVFTLPTGDTLTVTATAEGVKYVADTEDNNNTFTYELTNEDQYSGVSTTFGTLSITKAPLTITADSADKEYDGTPLTDDGWQDTAPEGLKGTDVVESVIVTGSITNVGTEDNVPSAAVIKNGVTDVTDNYNITYNNGLLEIKASTKALVITSSTESWTYDGETHTDEVYTVTYDVAEVEADGSGKVFTLPTGDTLIITATAEGVKYVADTEDSNNTFTYELTNAEQYTSVSTTFGTLSITKAPLTITADSADKEYDGTPLTDDGWQDTAPEGLKGTDVVESVTVTGSITNVGTEDNVPSAAVIKNGETDVTDNYNITYNNGLLEIKASTKALVITSSTESWTYDGETHTNEVYTVTYDGAEVEADWSGKVFTLPTGDTLTITATAEGVKNFNENYSSNNTFIYVLANENQYTNVSTTFGTLSITKAPLTITADSNEKEYDGTPLTDDGWQDTAPEGLKGTDVVESVTVTGTITTVGTEDNIPSNAIVKNGDTDVTDNYNITYDNGLLEIKASTKALVITSSTESWTYDGNAHTKYEYTVTYGDELYDVTIPDGEDTGTVALSTGDVVTITPAKSASITHVAENTVSNAFGYIVENSDQYANQTKEQGKLTITPATLTIITGTASREYDGTPLTAEGSISGFVTPDGGEEETATFTVTGTITEVGGPVENSYSLVWDGTAAESDYKLREDLGTLTITPNTKALVITSSTKSWTYDGETHTDEVYTVTYDGAEVEADGSGKVFTLPTGDTLIITATAEGVKDFSDNYSSNNTFTYELTNEDQYTGVSTTFGTLSITKAPLTITADSADKEYDGTPLTDDGWQDTAPEGLKGTDVVESVTVTGSITNVGTEDNVPSAAVIKNGETDVTDNYNITYDNGVLEIKASTKALVITSSTESWTYDGELHTDEVYTVTYDGAEVEADSTGKVFTLPTGDTLTITATAEGVKYVADTEDNNNTFTYELTNEDQYSGVRTTFGTLSITKAPLTITADSNEKEYDGTPLTDDGWQDTAPEGLKGTDVVESVTVTGTITNVGTEDNVPSNAIVKNGDTDVTDNYNITYDNGVLKIKASTKELKVVSMDGSWTYDGNAHTKYEYTVTYGDESYDVTIPDGADTGSVVLRTRDVVTITPAKSASITHVAENTVSNAFGYIVENSDQYANQTKEQGKLTITPATLTIITGTASREYDGTPLTAEGSISGFVTPDGGEEETATFTVTGTITEVGGPVENGYSLVWDGTAAESDYKLSEDLGTLTITPNTKDLVITSSTESWTYDGELHTDEVYTVTYDGAEVEADGSGKVFTLPTGDTLTITATAEGVKYVADTEDNNNTFTYELTDEDQYTGVSTTFGTLSITKAPLTITADSNEKEYDGTPLTDDGWQDTAPEGLKGTDVVESVTVTGSITNVGTEDNVPSAAVIKNGETDVTNNYNITYDNGVLKIKASTKELKVVSMDGSWTYDGNAHTKYEYTVTYGDESQDVTIPDGADTGTVALRTGDVVTITPAKSASITHVAENTVSNAFGYIVENSDQYANQTKEQGKLTITPATLTITTGTASREYDGTPLTADGSISGFVTPDGGEEETATFTVTGTITEVGGPVENGYSLVWDGTASESDYKLSEDLGTLTITPNTKALVITSSTKSWTYDGETHTDEVYTVTYDGAEVEADGSGKVFTLPTGDTLTITATAEGVKDFSENYSSNNTFTYMLANENQYTNVSTTFGTLSINKREVTVSVADAPNVEYDANEHTGVTAYTFHNVVPGQTASITYTPAKGTLVNTYTGSFANDFKVVDAGGADVTNNYELTGRTPGKLTITNRVNKYPITVTANSNTGNVYDGTEKSAEGFVTLTFTVDGNTFTVEGLATSDPGSVDVCDVPNAISGTAIVKDVNGNDVTAQFAVMFADGRLEITPREITISMADRTLPYNGMIQNGWSRSDAGRETVNGLVNSETVSIEYMPSSGNTAGTYTNGSYDTATLTIMNGDRDVTHNYSLTSAAAGNLTIVSDQNRKLSVASADQSWDYDAKVHTCQVYTVTYGDETLEGTEGQREFMLSSGDKLTVTPVRKGADGVKNVSDSGENSFIWTVENESSYVKGIDTAGTLTINALDLSIVMADRTLTYNSAVQYGWSRTDAQQETVTGLVNSETVTIEYTPSSGRTVGTYSNGSYDTETLAITDGGEDVTENYRLTSAAAGTLTIAKAPLTITADSNEKEYDGMPLADDGWQDTPPAGLQGDDAVESVTVTGTITTVGTEDNVPAGAAVKNSGADVTDNYDITYVNGTLEITQSTKALVITSADESWTYDGETHTKEAYTVTYGGEEAQADDTGKVFTLPTGDTVTVTATAEGVRDYSDDYSANNTFTYVLTNADQFADVSTSFGTLSIEKREVLLESGSRSREYNGSALTNEEVDGRNGNGLVTETGWVEGEGAEYAFTGSITAAGSVPNAFNYTLKDNTKAGNYTISRTEGTLEITASTAQLKITSADGNWTYDGTQHHKHEYTVSYGDDFSRTVTIEDGEDSAVVELPTGDKVTISADPGAYAEHVMDGEIRNAFAFEIEHADQYAETIDEAGTLSVSPRRITVSVEDRTTPYNGSTQFGNTDYVFENLVPGQIATIDYTPSQGKNVGGYDNGAFDMDSLLVLTSSQTSRIGGASRGMLAARAVIEGGNVTGDYVLVKKTPGKLIITAEGIDPGLVVTKSAADKEYAPGDTVTFDVNVTNIYDEEKTITLTELEGVELAQSVFENVEGGGTVHTTATYVITEEDVLNGSFTNTVTAEIEGGITAQAEAVADTVDKNSHLTVTKTAVSSPSDEQGYALGETIAWKVTVTNDGNVTILSIVVTDELTGDEWIVDVLKPGESESFTAEHVVTEEDVLEGRVVNTATVVGTDPEGEDPGMDPGEDEVPVLPTPESFRHLTVTKAVSSGPADGKSYTLGETITWKVTVTNDGGVTLTDVEVTDELTGDVWTVRSLEPGESRSFTAEHAVTEEDILNGKVVNTATATGIDPDGNEPGIDPGEDEQLTETVNSHLTVTKTAVSSSKNSKGYDAGETITWNITVTNDGNVTIRDITVEDRLVRETWLIKSLAPGESVSHQVSYTVTAEDQKVGSVFNRATATGVDPGGNEPETVPGEDEQPVIPPLPIMGDTVNMVPWIAAMAASGSAALTGGWMLRKRRREEDEED